MERLRFDADDSDGFEAARDRLTDEYAGWLRTHRGPSDHDLAEEIGVFLDWRWGYSSGELDRYQVGDLHEFFLEWCPRKLSAPSEIIVDLSRSVSGFIEFLATTDRLEGGAGAAAGLIVATQDLVPDAMVAMADPANFGMAKSLFGSALSEALEGAGSDDELQEILDRAMEEFNALPDAERRAATDRFAEPRRLLRELPFLNIAPAASEVEASAAAAPVLERFERLRDHLTSDERAGLPLDDGELDVDDAVELAAILVTGDVVDPTIDGRTIPTEASRELVGVMAMVAWAELAGAIEVDTDLMVPAEQWTGLSTLARTERAFAALVEVGPLALRGLDHPEMREIEELLDDGALHWMTMVLPAGSTAPFEHVLEVATEACRHRVDLRGRETLRRHLPAVVHRHVSTILDALVVAGVLVWRDREVLESPAMMPLHIGGELALTPLGRHLLPRYLDRVGYSVRTVEDPTAVSAPELLDLLVTSHVEPAPLVRAWWADRNDDDRVRALVDAIVAAPDADRRIAGFAALGQLDRPDASGPIVRQLLDSPVAGHAALFLLEHGIATGEEVGDFLDEGPLIDILATVTRDPEVMVELFLQATDRPGGPDAMLDSIWRQPAAETALVLETLGRHLPDKRLAKAARKALVKHRSWMADPNR